MLTPRAFLILLMTLFYVTPTCAKPPPAFCLDFPSHVPCPLPGDEDVVAIVEGAEIRGVDLRFRNQSSRAHPNRTHDATSMEFKLALLEEVIDLELLFQDAAARGRLEDREVQHRLLGLLDQQSFIRPALELEITEEQLNRYLESHPEEFVIEAYRHLQHRAVRYDSGCSEEEAQAEAEAFRVAFPEDRQAFDAALREGTRCSPAGEELGYLLLRPGETPVHEDLVAAAWKLEHGEVSDVIRSGACFHVLKRIGGGERTPITLENGRDKIRMAVVGEMIRSWRSEAAAGPRSWLEIAVDEQVLSTYRIGQGLPTEIVAHIGDIELTTEELDWELEREVSRRKRQGRAVGPEDIRARLEVEIDRRALYLAHRGAMLAQRPGARSLVWGALLRDELLRGPCSAPGGGYPEEQLLRVHEQRLDRYAFGRVVSVERLLIPALDGERAEVHRDRAVRLHGTVSRDWSGIPTVDAVTVDVLDGRWAGLVWIERSGALQLLRLDPVEVAAALALEEGEVSELIALEGEYSVLRCTRAVEWRPVTLDQVGQRGLDALHHEICEQEYYEAVYGPYLARLREGAVIEIHEDALEAYEVVPPPPFRGHGYGGR